MSLDKEKPSILSVYTNLLNKREKIRSDRDAIIRHLSFLRDCKKLLETEEKTSHKKLRDIMNSHEDIEIKLLELEKEP